MRVICEICKKNKDPDECWCVIDTGKKVRYFECKDKCKAPSPLVRHEPTSSASMEFFELDIVDEEDPSETVLVEDWIVQPQRTWLQWMKDLMGIQGYRYVKVKTS